MAENKRSTRPDIERTTGYWGYVLTGTSDALVQSGEVPPDWLLFGFDKDGRGRTVRTRTLTCLDRRHVTIKDIGRGRFEVWVRFTEEEAVEQLRLCDEKRRCEAEERYNREKKEREPKTKSEFRARAEEVVDFAFRLIQNYVGQGEGGFRFDTTAFDECVKARLAVAAAVKYGVVVTDGTAERPVLQLVQDHVVIGGGLTPAMRKGQL